MRHEISCDVRSRPAVRQELVGNFLKSERGSLTIFSIFLMPTLLILGGMAVDFMRFEGQRALIQDTADRATLMAANLEFTSDGDAVDVVDDFFAKANMSQYLDGPADVTETINGRTVQVNVTQPINTFFLQYVGIDTLDATATSAATQGIGNVEISLVLDISGSMRNATNTGQSKINAMKDAATVFINTALQDANKDRISLSLVPYSEHVNIGKPMFDRMNTTQLHNFSHCIDFEDADYKSTGISATQTYAQGQHIDHWSYDDLSLPYVNCPHESFQEVTAVSQDRAALLDQINKLEPYTQTSIFLGMKWGLAFLDPSTQSLVAPDLDPAFAGRPAAFSAESTADVTRKIIVVMTDGNNTPSTRIKEEYYNTPTHYAHWASQPVRRWFYDNTYSSSQRLSQFEEDFYSTEEGNALLKDSCDAAKANNVQVFAVAFEATDSGEAAMADCASSVNHYFNASGSELSAVFQSIAEQVSDLRLTQ